jgi:type II secretory pathway component GspD/PulD (secretin)
MHAFVTRLPLAACLLGAAMLLDLRAEELQIRPVDPDEMNELDTAKQPQRQAVDPQTVIEQLDAEQAAMYLEAEGYYQQALGQYKAARLLEAKQLVERSLAVFPGHSEAQELRGRLGALLSQRSDSLQATASWMLEQKNVAAQEQAVRVAGLIEDGDRALAADDFQAAHLAFDRAAIAMRTFSYEYDWGALPEQVEAKLAQAESLARQADLEAQRDARQQAREREAQLTELQEEVLDRKVDEIMRRAKDAYRRRDYRASAALAWNAYELDRRRDDARQLYMDAKRQGHTQFERWYEDERDERLARTNEMMHQALIPQTELLTYPEDWFRRSQRKPIELSESKQDAWVEQIKDRLEQMITVQFEDAELVDVVDFLRRTTGVNIIIATEVIADAAVPPITLSATNMKLKTALKWVMQITRLQMVIRNQAIFISQEGETGDIALHLYDISDLLLPTQDFTGIELGYGSSEEGFQIIDTMGPAQEADPQAMVDFIRQNVATESWDLEGRGIQLGSGGTLFVSQAPEVHDQIQSLLANIRSQQSLQVQITIRMLNVRKTFFEDIGVTWEMLENFNKADAMLSPGRGSSNQFPIQHQLLRDSDEGVQDTDRGLSLRGVFNYQDALTGPQVDLVLNAVEQEGDNQALVSPEITCYNGQRANAAFVEQIAYIHDYDIVVTGEDDGTPDPQLKVMNVGNIIDVRPIVSSDRKYITMEVRPSNTELERFETTQIRIFQGIGELGGGLRLSLDLFLPVVRVRSMRSTVMLPDKGSVVVGGVVDAQRERTHSGIPFLSHIPFVGRLFGRNGIDDVSRTLYYIVSAEILDLAERESRS